MARCWRKKGKRIEKWRRRNAERFEEARVRTSIFFCEKLSPTWRQRDVQKQGLYQGVSLQWLVFARLTGPRMHRLRLLVILDLEETSRRGLKDFSSVPTDEERRTIFVEMYPSRFSSTLHNLLTLSSVPCVNLTHFTSKMLQISFCGTYPTDTDVRFSDVYFLRVTKEGMIIRTASIKFLLQI